MAPIVVGNHVLVGTGDDLDAPGFLQSLDPETGKRQWIWYSAPMKKGDPGLETWKNLDARAHGGGQIWIPGAYDPETHLYITGTGNPSPAYTSGTSREGDNLYTCSHRRHQCRYRKNGVVLPDSPHDTHDWDSTETPILVDGEFGGRQRKMVLHAEPQRLLLHPRPPHRRAPRSAILRHGELGEEDERERTALRDPAKDFHIAGVAGSPTMAASPTGRRRLIRRTPACSMFRSRTAMRCTTSPRPIHAARWDWAARKKQHSARWAAI